ncbi:MULTISPECIES: DUF6214 family protein [unclassified Streptomyces]|uniref:DUF6214 family protein n=1 Tax=unclassified Streptomyces TaxID=2593676 RepID=UPI001661B196|nr:MULTISPECIES: DUF6214 family protein [unclassified Streptomyces]MBD0840588.1 hypothetical protein [Streptomyces sp. TRM68416]
MSVWPAWEVQEGDGATSWFQVRLAFTDGARVEAVAVVSEGRLSIEDVRAQPALSLHDLTELADWIEEPLFEACGLPAEPMEEADEAGEAVEAYGGARRARPAWPRGVEGRWLVAQEYRAAQEDGFDPVLAVMCATGHSRRKSLRLIAQARDAGFLTPRHARR